MTTYLTAHLEDEGQWRFEVSWQYDTDDVEFLSNGPTVVMTWDSLFWSTENTHGRDHVSMTMNRLDQGSGL